MITSHFISLLLFIVQGDIVICLVNVVFEETEGLSQLFDEISNLIKSRDLISNFLLHDLDLTSNPLIVILLIFDLKSKLWSRWVILSSVEPALSSWERWL